MNTPAKAPSSPASARKLAGAGAPPVDASQAALRAWAEMNPTLARQHAAQLRALRARLAREDPNAFVEFVMRDERDGVTRITQAATHRRMHGLIDAHPRVVLLSHVEAGKTNQVSIGRVLYEIGRDPNLRVAVCCATLRQATHILTAIKAYIERSVELREVFPHLRPGGVWTGTAITVERPTRAKDPTVQVFGADTGAVLGARIDLLVMDDVATAQTTRTATQREKTWSWWQSTLEGRLTEHSRVVLVGNAFDTDDLLHRLGRNPLFVLERFPVLNKHTGELYWPEVWSRERIEAKRLALTAHEFGRQMLCEVTDDANAKFKREWIDKCLERGEGRAPTFALRAVPPGYRTFTGVDLAVSKKSSADLTALVSIIVHPDETREVLCIETGKLAGPEIVERIKDHHDRFGSIVVVESNAAQAYIAQFLKGSGVPVREFYTGTNKLNPEFGIESMATEMAAGKWIIPNRGRSMDKEIAAWVNEMIYYDPNAHTGDRLMASWFAREATRHKPPRAERGRVDLLRR